MLNVHDRGLYKIYIMLYDTVTAVTVTVVTTVPNSNTS